MRIIKDRIQHRRDAIHDALVLTDDLFSREVIAARKILLGATHGELGLISAMQSAAFLLSLMPIHSKPNEVILLLKSAIDYQPGDPERL